MRALQKKREEEARGAKGAGTAGAAGAAGTGGAGEGVSVPPSVLRAKRDLQEYTAIPQVTLHANPQTPMEMGLDVDPVEGLYAGGHFKFQCRIPADYPNSAPEFVCLQRIYHPNIDPEGHVCLNILRSDWKPTLTLQLIFAGILHLFLEPNPNDPLNKDAANMLAKFPLDFSHHVRNAMYGGMVEGVRFDRVL